MILSNQMRLRAAEVGTPLTSINTPALTSYKIIVFGEMVCLFTVWPMELYPENAYSHLIMSSSPRINILHQVNML